MASKTNNKNIEELVQNNNILNAHILNLQEQTRKAQKEYAENDTKIKKIEVSYLDKNSIIKKLGYLISIYNEDENDMYNNRKEVNRIYGTHEYCRNIHRGNWYTINSSVIFGDNVSELWSLFPMSLEPQGHKFIEERYAFMTSSHATEVRNIMETLSKIYKYSD